MSLATPLFIRSANGRNSVGLNREKWVPNPSANAALHLAMFEFVGVLMGIALCTKVEMPPSTPHSKSLIDRSRLLCLIVSTPIGFTIGAVEGPIEHES